MYIYTVDVHHRPSLSPIQTVFTTLRTWITWLSVGHLLPSTPAPLTRRRFALHPYFIRPPYPPRLPPPVAYATFLSFFEFMSHCAASTPADCRRPTAPSLPIFAHTRAARASLAARTAMGVFRRDVHEFACSAAARRREIEILVLPGAVDCPCARASALRRQRVDKPG